MLYEVITVLSDRLSVQVAINKGETSLGIELGSTRIKAVLIDHSFQTIASGIV